MRRDTFLSKLKRFYLEKYKLLFFIPVLLFIISGLIVLNTYLKTGDFIKRDVTLKGGISLTLRTNFSDVNYLSNYLSEKFPEASINIRTIASRGKTTGLIVEASDISQDDLLDAVKSKINFMDYSIESMGSSLGESFFKQMFIALLLAFFGMGFVFHVYFKNLYATFAALISAFFDIFITLGIMDLLEVRLTAGGIASYLMLIGYSIDTSILISTKMLKEAGIDGLFQAMKTGLTMSAAGIAATSISYLLTNNVTLKQIMLILVVGLLIDLVTTWFGNVGFLRFYIDKNIKQ